MFIILLVLLSISPNELLDNIDAVRLPTQYKAIFLMKNHLQDGREITYKFEGVEDRDKGSYLEILEPSREQGRKFLLIGSNIWMYAPEIGKTIRLSSRDRFLGSEFSNSDLMEGNYKNNYYAVSIDSINNFYLLELEGKDPSSPYKSISLEVRKSNYIPSVLKFYTLSGRFFREMVMDSIKLFEGEPYATYLKMTNIITPDSYTEVKVLSIKRLESISSSLFKPENLGR